MKLNFNTRKLKYGSASTIYIVIFIAIIILANILAGYLTDRFSLKLDMTTEQRYTLDESTKEMLKALPGNVNIYILSTEAAMKKSDMGIVALETIQRYNSESGGKVSYEFIDPNKNPRFFEEYPDAIGSGARALVIVGSERYKVVESQEFAVYLSSSEQQSSNYTPNKIYYQSEEILSSAILHVSSPEVSNAGFVTGHNEIELPAIEQIFEGNHFEVKDVNLLEGIPDDVTNLVISAPTVDYTADEINTLEQYLAQDGNTLYVFWNAAAQPLPELEMYLAEWGFAFPQKIVYDETNGYQYPYLPIAEAADNKIIDSSSQGQLVPIFPDARPIDILFESGNGRVVSTLMQSMKTAYAKSLENTISTYSYEAGDERGPFIMAAISENYSGSSSNQASRVIAFSTYGFVNEDIMGIPTAYNSTFLAQVIGYSNPNTLTMQIAPKISNSFDLNLRESQVRMFQFLLVYVLPILILGAGIFVFVRRKNR